MEPDISVQSISDFLAAHIPGRSISSELVASDRPKPKRLPPGKLDFTVRLPPEIIMKIFKRVYLLSLGSSTHPPVSGKIVRDICWPVSQVCAYWRDAALDLPFLWAHLPRLNLDYRNEEALAEQSEILKVLLYRIRNHPLHVSVIGPNIFLDADIPDTAFGLMGPMIHDLTQCSGQWQSFSINAIPVAVELFFQFNASKRFPRLEALTIDFFESPNLNVDVTIFRHAPNLKFVCITGSAPEGRLFLNTGSLVRLHDNIGALLQSIAPTYHGFSRLTDLRLRDADILWDPIDHEAFVFPVLKTLHYYRGRSNVDDGFMRYAITPALEELSIQTKFQGNIMEELLGMCLRNGDLLLKTLRLRVRWKGCNMNGLEILLRLLPTLEVLDTHLPSIAIISFLSASQGPEVLVPRLRKCSFLWEGKKLDGMHQALAQFASARCSPLLTVLEEERLAVMQLSFQTEVNGPRSEHQRRYFVALQPTKLEPWYGDEYEHWQSNPRKVYFEAQAILPATMPFRSSGQIDPNWKGYHHTLELLEKSYNATQINQFLETNTNIWMIALAHTFKECCPVDDQGRNPPYERVVHLMKTVKEDLMKRLDDFHWIWETTPHAYYIRYIPDQHEMRADRDEFANAILGLSGDKGFWTTSE